MNGPDRSGDPGQLIVVPTPIGNLEDITLRGLRVLRQADLIACEDTRRTGRLLQLLELPKQRLMSLNARNEQGRIEQILALIGEGMTIALVSDAGTPGLSDPGIPLISAAIAAGIEPIVLPGASALLPAIVASAFPMRRFWFEGFLPHKKGRQTRISVIAKLEEPVVLYESPHRIIRLLNELIERCGAQRSAVVLRELTKLHEEVTRGSLSSLHDTFSARERIKGEFVLVLGPHDVATASDAP